MRLFPSRPAFSNQPSYVAYATVPNGVGVLWRFSVTESEDYSAEVRFLQLERIISADDLMM